MNLIKSLLSAARSAKNCPWFSVFMLLALLVGVGVTRWYYKPKPLGNAIVAEPLKRYEPGIAYQILNAPSWRLTGKTVDGVPVVEPADEQTEKLAERVLGPEGKDAEFLFVGDIGRVGRAGADVYVVSPPPMPEVEVPESASEVDLSSAELPRGVSPRQPTRLILVARPDPLFDWRDPHRIEATYGARFEDVFEQEWRLTYRPGELWIKGRVYLFVEGGIYQQRGDVIDTGIDLFARGGGGLCINKEEC